MICKLFRHNMLVSGVWYSLPRHVQYRLKPENMAPAELVLSIHLDS